ncbi:Uncharacterised protein [Mycobacteroides abscessus subsp. abscessus]|nr:Uncharacterised protein [Mycobacteroides abscessus subsp. abscessus]
MGASCRGLQAVNPSANTAADAMTAFIHFMMKTIHRTVSYLSSNSHTRRMCSPISMDGSDIHWI